MATEENFDAIVKVFRDHYKDKKPPRQIYAQMLSMFAFLGGGAHFFALERCAHTDAPVYLYMIGYDTPLLGFKRLGCAWHTADLPLIFRAVYLPQCETLSRYYAHALGAFARTGSPDTKELPWKPFTEKDRETMYFDDISACQKDPLHDIYEEILRVKGGRF